jgi:hypothetical protein
MACAYFTAVSEPGEKSVARRIFSSDSAVTGSSVFMRAPHSLSRQFINRVTTEDVTAVTLEWKFSAGMKIGYLAAKTAGAY